MFPRFKSFSVVLLTLVAASLVLSGCSSGNSSSGTSTSRLRVLHASPDAPNVDVLADNTRVLSNVPYKAASDYLNVTAGIRNVKVNAAGTNTTVINANVPLISGSDTTVLAVGRVANIEPLVLTDNNASPAAGNVKVRLVHASPAAGVVDIYVTAPGVDIASVNPTLANIPFKVASGYLEVPAGAYRVRITPVGQKIVAIDTGTLNLTAGQIRTGVAVGDPGVGQPLTAVLLADKN